jgi:hypothetical protein
VTCGGTANVACPQDTEFCELPAGVCDTVPTATGTCVQEPTTCAPIFVFVCGCDGVTYGSDCERQAAGVAKLKDGAC